MKKLLAILLSAVMIGSLAACGSQSDTKSSSTSDSETTAPAETKTAEPKTNLPKLDNSKWKYNEDNEFYYQIGIDYCEKPVDENLQKAAFIVPEKYMDATDNKNGTFTCKFNDSADINGYTASNAPIVMPIATEGYYSAEALTEEAFTENPFFSNSISEYTSQGFVYVFPGCRGIQEGAPTGVTDLKAAIRYVRYCDDVVPGDAEIYLFSE